VAALNDQSGAVYWGADVTGFGRPGALRIVRIGVAQGFFAACNWSQKQVKYRPSFLQAQRAWAFWYLLLFSGRFRSV
jgi:hypothetical protein